ncbi:MAG: AsmA family protein [Rikenellaceae bacterium]|nr:AsmA family protein [Rikenellaceae bacterium]
MKLRKKIFITIFSLLFAIIIVLPCAAVAIIKWGILPPHKLTPIVLNIINPLIDGKVDCESIELTFWETFPRVGLKLTEGEIISYALKDTLDIQSGNFYLSDTLLSFSRIVVTVNIMDYFDKDRITVERLFIDNPYFYGFTDENGNSNWELLPGEEHENNLTESSEVSVPVVDLQRIRIKNGHFIYEDRASNLYAETSGFHLLMRNKLTRGNLNTEIKTGFETLVYDSPAYTLDQELSMQFESIIDLSHGKIEFEDAKMTINDIPFHADGRLEKLNDNFHVDITFDMGADNLADILAFAPDEYFQDRRKITAKGVFALQGRINGMIGDSIQPDIRLGCVIDNGALIVKGSDYGIERLNADMNLYLNGRHPDSSFIAFRKLDVKATNTSFSASGYVDKMLTDPYVDVRIKGSVDFAGLMQDIINPDSMIVRGIMDADIEAAFKVRELLDGDFSHLKAAGKFDIDRIMIVDKISGTNLFVKGAQFSADTTRQNSRYLSNEDLISAVLQIDTLNLRYQNEINTQIHKLDVQVKTSRTIDTTTVIPVTTNIKIDNLRARLPDSVWVAGNNIFVAGGLKASDSDNKKGVFAGTISVDTLRYFDVPSRTRIIMEQPSFSVQIMPLRDAMRQRIAITSTNGAALSARNSGNRAAASADRVRSRAVPVQDSTGGEMQLQNSGEVSNTERQSAGLLRNWEVRGSVKFNTMNLFTAFFPLPMSIDNTTLRFDTDKITLTNARMRAGRSDFTLSGEINNMRRAMYRNGVLQAKLSLSSKYIDCNQLMRALNQIVLLSETSDTPEEEFIESWYNDTEITEVELSDSLGVFVVPGNIDLILTTSADKVDFKEVKLENIEGVIIIRNQNVNLHGLKMDSNIGSGKVTMVYSAKNPYKASTGFELEMEDIIVEKLIDMFPSIEDLLPMLRSFEGVVDCQISATCELDSAMNVVFPTLHSACYISGENMVLMDGETFAEISKKLMFKNKERNLIDYISVDLSIEDNKIEIFPFMVELDRYKLAVGGTHNLDMSFDYHVSVIKSPVPFKLGVDIKGDLDNFRFKIVKCKYKNIFTPAREQELEAARLNLRSAIRESIRKQLTENAPEFASSYTNERIRSRRAEPVVTDPDEEDESYLEDESDNIGD